MAVYSRVGGEHVEARGEERAHDIAVEALLVLTVHFDSAQLLSGAQAARSSSMPEPHVASHSGCTVHGTWGAPADGATGRLRDKAQGDHVLTATDVHLPVLLRPLGTLAGTASGQCKAGQHARPHRHAAGRPTRCPPVECVPSVVACMAPLDSQWAPAHSSRLSHLSGKVHSGRAVCPPMTSGSRPALREGRAMRKQICSVWRDGNCRLSHGERPACVSGELLRTCHATATNQKALPNNLGTETRARAARSGSWACRGHGVVVVHLRVSTHCHSGCPLCC